MTYDFDKPVDRRGSGDLKHEVLQERYGRSDLLPLWVADMDWETPSFITNALKQRLEHSLYGYTVEPKDYWPTVQQWIETHHQWKVEREWMTYIPGIVKGIGMVINFFLKEDEKVIVQPPIYHPFYLTPRGNKREVVWNPLKEIRDAEGKLISYEMDFENLEKICTHQLSTINAQLSTKRPRLLILSN